MDLRRRLVFALVVLFLVTGISVLGYRLLGQNVSFLQALYMAVITLAGVGYGEVVDTSTNPWLRVFNMFVVLVGVTITVYVFSTVTAFLVEGELTDIFWRRKMLKRIAELRNHYIICGLGDTGRAAIEELHKTGTPYVIIEAHEDNIKKLREHKDGMYKEVLYILGDATDEEILDQAVVEHAKGVIPALSVDKDNLVITVMVRQKNPHVRIVARCTDLKFSDRMLKAGANSTVSPNHIGGLRLVSEAMRPHVVGFLDLMLKERSRALRIEELDVPKGSSWVGKQVGAMKFRETFNLLPLAVKNLADGHGADFTVNPPDTTLITEGMILIMMGDMADIRRARHDAERHHALAAGK